MRGNDETVCKQPAWGRLRRRGRIAGSGSLHRAVDKQTGAIRAFDLPIGTETEEDPGMAERLVAAIAGSDRPVDVDGFERSHIRPGKMRGR